jgi:hypothetical protein
MGAVLNEREQTAVPNTRQGGRVTMTELSEKEMEEVDIEWCRQVFRTLKDGGRWTEPHTGLVFQKSSNRFLLVGQVKDLNQLQQKFPPVLYTGHGFLLTSTEDLSATFPEFTIDNSTKVLSKKQRLDYHALRILLEKAGITVEDRVGYR